MSVVTSGTPNGNDFADEKFLPMKNSYPASVIGGQLSEKRS